MARVAQGAIGYAARRRGFMNPASRNPHLSSASGTQSRASAISEPRPEGGFVGREREMGELVAGLDDAVAGRGGLFLLSGEPGIGKSRLADEFAAHAKERGGRVLWGRCWEAGGAPPYWPWVQAFR